MIVHAPVAVSQQAPVGGGTGQVVRLHGTSAPSQVKPQAASVVIVHAPVAVSQQAPVGGGTGQVVRLHGTSAPSQVKPQAASVVIVHAPVAVSQQAPVGRRNRAGREVARHIRTEPGEAARGLGRDRARTGRRVAASTRRRRNRAGRQVARHIRTEPGEAAGGLGRDRAGTGGVSQQAPCRRRNRAGREVARQRQHRARLKVRRQASVVIVQAPVVRIAASTGRRRTPGRSSDVHGTSAPSQVKPHATSVVIVHAPVAVSQQAPVGGGTGQFVTLHGMSVPSQLELQAAWVVIVHAPVAKLQQAPVGCGQLFGNAARPLRMPHARSDAGRFVRDGAGTGHQVAACRFAAAGRCSARSSSTRHARRSGRRSRARVGHGAGSIGRAAGTEDLLDRAVVVSRPRTTSRSRTA